MATKHTDRTLKAAGDTEEIFVLRAQDILAPQIVREWAARFQEAHQRQGTFQAKHGAKYLEALDVADQMEQWATPKLPD